MYEAGLVLLPRSGLSTPLLTGFPTFQTLAPSSRVGLIHQRRGHLGCIREYRGLESHQPAMLVSMAVALTLNPDQWIGVDTPVRMSDEIREVAFYLMYTSQHSLVAPQGKRPLDLAHAKGAALTALS